jgi:cytochrome b subunit of formate dehydrogenase
MHAIVHGDVTTAWARHHHRLWADEVTEHAASTRPPADRSA